LSVFQQTWRLQHSGSMQGVLQAASSAVYYGIAHLIQAGSLSPIMGTSFVDVRIFIILFIQMIILMIHFSRGKTVKQLNLLLLSWNCNPNSWN
jgi:hypothetical protein